jgi:nitrogen regulatory protein PII
MKMIVATIRPHKFDDIKDALAHLRIHQITIFKVMTSDNEPYDAGRIGEESDLVEKVRIEISVDDDVAPRIVETIREIANTGNVGDGVIAMYDIIQSIRIHSNEKEQERKS